MFHASSTAVASCLSWRRKIEEEQGDWSPARTPQEDSCIHPDMPGGLGGSERDWSSFLLCCPPLSPGCEIARGLTQDGLGYKSDTACNAVMNWNQKHARDDTISLRINLQTATLICACTLNTLSATRGLRNRLDLTIIKIAEEVFVSNWDQLKLRQTSRLRYSTRGGEKGNQQLLYMETERLCDARAC